MNIWANVLVLSFRRVDKCPEVCRRHGGWHAAAAGKDEARRIFGFREQHLYRGADMIGGALRKDIARRDIAENGHPVA